MLGIRKTVRKRVSKFIGHLGEMNNYVVERFNTEVRKIDSNTAKPWSLIKA